MKKHHFLLIIAAIFTWVSFAYAQTEPVRLLFKQLDADNTPFVNEQDYPQLQMELSPLNEASVPLVGLSEANFTLLDGNMLLEDVSVAPFVDVEQPVSVLLVLDVSGGMQGVLPEVKTAVNSFYLALEQTDESAVIAFASYADGQSVDVDNILELDPARELGFTNDEGALRNLINAQRVDPEAGTPMYDAVYKAIQLTASQAANERQAVILVTNGADRPGGEGTTGSRIANETFVNEEARKFTVPIFTIGIDNDVDIAFLQQAAVLTNGSFSQVPGQAELADALAGIVHQLKQAYRVTATAVTPADNMPHPLSITVSSPNGVGRESVDFLALYPDDPQIQDVQLQLADGDLLSLETVRDANGTLTIVPQIVSRHPLSAVNYYVDDAEAPVFQANAGPWIFAWDTRSLPANRPYTLIVEAVDRADPPHIGRYEKQIVITPCNLLCRLGIPMWVIPILLAVLLVVLLVILVARTRGGTAVPPLETTPTSSVLQRPVEPYAQPSFPPAGPALQSIPRLDVDEVPPAGSPPPTPVLINEETSESFPLQYDLRIGSDPGTNIRLAGDTVADHHAIIKRESSQYVLVVNARHKKLTAINGEPVENRVILTDGDVIEIGDHCLKFVISEEIGRLGD